VQDACLRAFKFFHGFRGGDPRAWLLTIVRNTVYSSLRGKQRQPILQSDEEMERFEDLTVNPTVLLERAANIEAVRAAIAQLTPEFREVIVLREMENFSYKEIADITGVRLGTVMSRLSRGRRELHRILAPSETVSGEAAL
jgi:RNA polymerase sigma-70 factor (ECF subfamily)